MLATRLLNALGPHAVKVSREDRAAYSYDASNDEALPAAVVIPADTRETCIAVRIANACGEPIIARGAGTGLCGGAVPIRGGLVISFSRMNRLLSLDVANRRARVQPGLVNLALSQATLPDGLFFGPDPSSQKISTLGGNTSTNAGGPHALSYGSMNAHVLGLEFVDEDGEVRQASLDDPGYDLVGIQVGAEGTLGILTAIELRLLRVPPAVRVAIAAFPDVESASAAVSEIIASGIIPTALEIMDRVITQAVEAHYHTGFPTDAGAVLLIEIAGLPDDVAAFESTIGLLIHRYGALSWRVASDASERAALWASRKNAAAAVGRLAPNYYIQDATVPRTKLPQAMRTVGEIARTYRLPVGNVFHAGDGNLHPLLLFDRRLQRQVDAVHAAGTEILQACIELGGTISGEHGIGFEKRESLTYVFSPEDLAAMGRLREALDPARMFNPDKIFPSGASCGEVRPNLGFTAKPEAGNTWI
ncbi:MAG TPA: FAD-linked oxidase C-terminal domain-containing protein [Candidatus Baltobacteraceae bacterium]|nr:FAD-linked oxidase C-terminal domain-containing protein [Candidatus Baltobacteraceae bacterium]